MGVENNLLIRVAAAFVFSAILVLQNQFRVESYAQCGHANVLYFKRKKWRGHVPRHHGER